MKGYVFPLARCTYLQKKFKKRKKRKKTKKEKKKDRVIYYQYSSLQSSDLIYRV